MFRKIVILSVFLGSLMADPVKYDGGKCGATYNSLGDFYTIFENAKSDSKVQSARNAFSGFDCTSTNSNDGVYILNYIDFETGNYTCLDVSKVSATIEETIENSKGDDVKFEGNVISKTNSFCSTDINNLYEQIGKDDYKISQPKPAKVAQGQSSNGIGYTGNFGQDYIGFFATNYWSEKGIPIWGTTGVTNTNASIGLDFASMQQLIKKVKDNAKSTPNISIQTIDTAKDNEPTFAEILTGLITLNSDYFKDGSIITSGGKANLNLSNRKFYGNTEQEETTEAKFQEFQAFESYFNTDLWSFYISFIENMRNAETYVILFFFAVGFFGLIGQKMIQFGYSSFWKEDSREDLQLKKMVTGPLIMLAVFTAPVVPSQMTIPAEYLNQTSEVSAGIILNSSGSSTTGSATTGQKEADIQNSTIIQSAIRYFAHFGVISANKFADYALYPYLKYLQQQLLGNYQELANDYEDYLTEFQKELLVLQKEFEFYQYFCRPLYKGENDNFSTISSPSIKNNISKSELSYTSKTAKIASEILNENNIKANTISSNFCAYLDMSLEEKSAALLMDYNFKIADLRLLAEQQERRLNKTSSKQNLLDRVLIQSAANQEKFGWINSIITPATYIALVADELKDQTQEKREIRAAQETQSKSISEDVMDTAKAFSDSENAVREFLESHATEITYFIFPGFTNIFTFTYNSLEKTTAGVATGAALMLLGPKKILGGVKKGFNIIKQMSQKVSGRVALFGGSIATSALMGLTKLGIAYKAFQISISIYMIGLSVLSIAFALALLIAKTAFYFIELLFFFVASPVVVIWSVIQNKTEVIWHYMGRGLVLTITPILIVLSVYVFIFSMETFLAVFNMAMSIYESLFLSGAGDSLGVDLTAGGVQIILYAIIQFIILITAFVVIYKFPSWFLNTIGARTSTLFEEGVGHFKDATMKNIKSPIA